MLVTGATGLIGSWLSRRLVEEGADVVALVLDDDPRSEFYRSGTYRATSIVSGRLESYADIVRAITLHEVDTVLHLGAQTLVGAAHAAPMDTFEANIRGTYHVLEACRVHSTKVERVVVASSDKAYGHQPGPYTEDMPMEGRFPYEVSKSCADLLARSYAATYGLPVVTTRCGNVYGGGDLNWSRIVPGAIRALHAGKPPILRSNGMLVRDYVYVEDVADAYLLSAANASREGVRGEALNVSEERPMSVLDLVGRIQREMGREDLKPVILDQAVGEIRTQSLSARKIRETLGWTPRHGLDEGLRRTIAWYQRFLGGPA